MKRLSTVLVLLLGVAAGTLAAMWLTGRGPFSKSPPPEPPRELAKAAAGAEPPHVRGADGASVELEEFADFECPPCGALYPRLKDVEREYGARLRVVFRQFPLTEIHPHALEAARAAEAAALQGRFWEMHDLLYEHQDEWTRGADARTLFAAYARTLGLDPARLARDMDSAQVSERIRADQRRGESIDLPGTPSLFLNGRELSARERTPAGLHDAIEAALGRARP